jgi:hypothetical protein
MVFKLHTITTLTDWTNMWSQSKSKNMCSSLQVVSKLVLKQQTFSKFPSQSEDSEDSNRFCLLCYSGSWVPAPLKTRFKGFLLQLYVSSADLCFLHCSIQIRQTWELLNCKQEQTKIIAWWNLDLKMIWLFLWIASLISCKAEWEQQLFFELTKLY